MNKFLAFFLIFAVSFVLLPYCATIGVRRDTTPAIAQVNAPEQRTEQTLQPQRNGQNRLPNMLAFGISDGRRKHQSGGGRAPHKRII